VHMKEWLIRLGMTTAPTMTAEDAKVRVMAYLPFLTADFGPDAFTEASLAHCVRRMRFFPSYAELRDELAAWLRDHAPRLALPAPDHPLWPKLSGHMDAAEFRAWIAPLRVGAGRDEVVCDRSGAPRTVRTITLAAPTRFHADHVRQHYASALETATGARVEIVASPDARRAAAA